MEQKTGLVLEGGGMRGIYTAGVLDLFMDQGVTFDGVIGVSARSHPRLQLSFRTARAEHPIL